MTNDFLIQPIAVVARHAVFRFWPIVPIGQGDNQAAHRWQKHAKERQRRPNRVAVFVMAENDADVRRDDQHKQNGRKNGGK